MTATAGLRPSFSAQAASPLEVSAVQSIAGFDVSTNSGLRVYRGNRRRYRRDGAAPSFQSHTLAAPRGSSSHGSPVGACHP